MVLLPLIIILNTTSLYSVARDQTISVFSPVFESCQFFFLNLSDGIERIRNYAEIYRTYESIELELERLRYRNIELREVQLENERLATLLKLQKKDALTHMSASVIGRDVSPWMQWLLINIGAEKGVEKDMPIIAPGGLVGRVASIGRYASRCMLLIDSQSRVSAIVQESRETGIIRGQGSELLKLTYLHLDSKATIGDVVVSSGLGGIYPKGIPIGKIVSIEADQNGLHLFAKVKPFVDFSKLEEVICLKKSN